MKTWRYIQEDGVSPEYGLGCDEFLMTQPRPTLRLYTYRSDCALVGRFQNIEAELDLDACRKEGLGLGRRLTGGGAIIMGERQLGLCITAPATFETSEMRPGEIYHLLSEPIISALTGFGVRAEFGGKNDLEVEGRKIAGLGVYYDENGRMLFHASILVDLDIDLMLRVLRISARKISDKVKIRSVRQRITTLSELCGREVTVDEFRSNVKRAYENSMGIQLDAEEITAGESGSIREIAASRYLCADWLFQRTPQQDVNGVSVVKTPSGLLRTYIAMMGETIKSVLITGDFLDHASFFQRIEARLKWQRFDRDLIAAVVRAAMDERPNAQAIWKEDDIVRAVYRAGERAMAESAHTYNGSCYYPEHSQPRTEIVTLEKSV